MPSAKCGNYQAGFEGMPGVVGEKLPGISGADQGKLSICKDRSGTKLSERAGWRCAQSGTVWKSGWNQENELCIKKLLWFFWASLQRIKGYQRL